MAAKQVFMKMADLSKAARIKSLEATGESTRQSFAIPVAGEDGVHLFFLYYPAQALARQPAKIGPPRFILDMEASGVFKELRAVTPKELGQSHRPEEAIGVYGSPPGLTSEQYFESLDRLNQAYDLVLPRFGARQSSADPETKAAAKGFKTLFQLLVEQPLLPYYQALGKDFFAWIDRMAK